MFILCELQARSAHLFILRELRIRRRRGVRHVGRPGESARDVGESCGVCFLRRGRGSGGAGGCVEGSQRRRSGGAFGRPGGLMGPPVGRRLGFIERRGNGEIPRLTLFPRDDFVDRRKLIPLVTFAGGPDRIGGFGAGGRNGSQQELGEMAEGGGFLARDTPLREQAKNLGEGAVHASGGGEVAAGGKEFGKIECGANDVTSGCRIAKQLFFSLGVESAERGMNVGARHSALAPVGEEELAALGQWVGVYEAVIAAKLRRGPSLTLYFVDRRKLIL